MSKLEELLSSKKISYQKMKNDNPQIIEEWENLLTQMHPESFVAQKKFLFNDLRRKYNL
jgi:hypothetical protein